MAQSSRPRSDSSASNKKKYQHERAHARSSRQVRTGTPRVLNHPSSASSSAGSRNAAARGAGSRQGGTSRSNARTNSRTTGKNRSTRQAQGARDNRGSRSTVAPKKRTAPRRRGGIRSKLLIVLAVLVVLVGGFIALYFSPVFPITQVEASGNEKLESSYVISLAAVPEDSTFLRTDTEGIKQRLLQEPWIQSAEVERSFPGTLILHITEQPVAAVVDIVPESANDTTHRWIIAEDGTWIAQVSEASAAGSDESTEAAEAAEGEAAEGAEGEGEGEADDTEGSESTEETDDTSEGDTNSVGGSTERIIGTEISAEELVNIPKIKDVSAAVRPVAGEVETDEGITNALALLAGFSDEMRAMVASISASDVGNTTLTLYNNVLVAFGAAEDIEAKEQAIATLLAEYEGTITSINVRVADRPTYRATGQ